MSSTPSQETARSTASRPVTDSRGAAASAPRPSRRASLIALGKLLVARQTVPEWQAVLDAIQEVEYIGAGPVGYWGVSLGCGLGVPFVADEPRVRAAVLGLGGASASAEAAARITVPVEFLVQWDDERVPRAQSLALFDALASAQKTLHANPGKHGEVPRAARRLRAPTRSSRRPDPAADRAWRPMRPRGPRSGQRGMPTASACWCTTSAGSLGLRQASRDRAAPAVAEPAVGASRGGVEAVQYVTLKDHLPADARKDAV